MATATDNGTKPRRQCDITREANANARKARVCERCGVGFIQGRLSAKQLAVGHVQKFCSRACSHAHNAETRRVYATEADSKRAYWARRREREGKPIVGSTRPCVVCDQPFPIANTNSRHCSTACTKLSLHRQRTFHCAECGALHAPEYGDKANVYCSPACRKKASRAASRVYAKASGAKAADRKARKLRKRGVTVEPVNAIRVLDRDNWTCQLCGVKTPRKLRGTFERPLARGPSTSPQ